VGDVGARDLIWNALEDHPEWGRFVAFRVDYDL